MKALPKHLRFPLFLSLVLLVAILAGLFFSEAGNDVNLPDESALTHEEKLVQEAWNYLANDAGRIVYALGADDVVIQTIRYFPHVLLDSHLSVHIDAIIYDHLFVDSYIDYILTTHEIVIHWRGFWDGEYIWTIESIRPFMRYVDTRIHFEMQRLVEDDTFNMRVYFLTDDPEMWVSWWEYTEHEISSENWAEEVIYLLNYHGGYRIHHMWLHENRLFVDLKPVERSFVFDGSFAGNLYGSALLNTLFELPGVYEIELLFGGNRDERDNPHDIWGERVFYLAIGIPG